MVPFHITPKLSRAWSKPERLAELVAAVGAPAAYSVVQSFIADEETLVALKNAARLQILRSRQMRQQALSLAAELHRQKFNSCIAGDLASGFYCYPEPYRRLQKMVIIVAPAAQHARLVSWLGDMGYRPRQPFSKSVRQNLWKNLDNSEFAPLHPARGHLCVCLHDRLPELSMTTVELMKLVEVMPTEYGEFSLIPERLHIRSLISGINGYAYDYKTWLQHLFDIGAYAQKHCGPAAIVQAVEGSSQEKQVLAVLALLGEAQEKSEIALWFRSGIAYCIAAGSWPARLIAERYIIRRKIDRRGKMQSSPIWLESNYQP